MKIVKPSVEYYWNCPHCERTCLSPYIKNENMKVTYHCSTCGKEYEVEFKDIDK